MGDRANVEIKDGDSSVFLYTHWNGTELPETVRAALKRGKSRWDDPQYLARIVFCEMIKNASLTSETGFGISARVHDGEDRVITLDTKNQTVTWKGKSTPFQDW